MLLMLVHNCFFKIQLRNDTHVNLFDREKNYLKPDILPHHVPVIGRFLVQILWLDRLRVEQVEGGTAAATMPPHLIEKI